MGEPKSVNSELTKSRYVSTYLVFKIFGIQKISTYFLWHTRVKTMRL